MGIYKEVLIEDDDFIEWFSDLSDDDKSDILDDLNLPVDKAILDLARVLLYRDEQEFISTFKTYINHNTELYIP